MNRQIVQMFILVLFFSYNYLSAPNNELFTQVFFGSDTKIDIPHHDFLKDFAPSNALITEEVKETEEKSDFPSSPGFQKSAANPLSNGLCLPISVPSFEVFFQKVPGFILYHNLKIPLSI
ncbi:hypothetical protein [Cecembia rubra]|nr:hypothetical protein [Cecembia rubra]